eukprot:g2870.t1
MPHSPLALPFPCLLCPLVWYSSTTHACFASCSAFPLPPLSFSLVFIQLLWLFPCLLCPLVWYSSSWDAETLHAFRRGVAKVLQQPHTPQDAEVREYVAHWASHNVSLSTARDQWLQRFRPNKQGIGNWKRRSDRLAMAEYAVTGELAGGGAFGSVCMFSHPHSKSQSEWMQSAVETLRFDELIQLHMYMASAQKDTNWNVLASATAMLLHGVQQLIEAVQSKKIVIEAVHHARVTPNSAVLKEIAAMKPWTVSWGNALDFLRTKDFHYMARAVSRKPDGEGTLHFAYSTRWLTDVKGAALIDYDAPEAREQALTTGKKLTADSYKMMKASDWLVTPPTGSPLLVGGLALEYAYFMKWGKWFLAQGEVPQEQAVVLPSVPNPWQSTHTVVFLTWTYDPNIKLQDVASVKHGK